MNRFSLLSLILMFVSLIAFSQESKVFDELTLTSKILNMERKYAVYLPP